MPTLSTIGAACARAWGFTSGLVKDQYFNLVSLLLPGNGTDGKQNRTFKDSSVNDFLITPNGNATQGTFSPFSQTGWGNYLPTASDRLTTSASNSGFSFGTGDFTIEGWMYPTAATEVMLFQMSTASTGYNPSFSNTIAAYVSASSKFEIYANGANNASTNAVFSSSNINQWHHFAIVRSSGTTKVYFDGTVITGLSSISDSTNYSMTYCVIGTVYDNSYSLKGYLSNLRVVKGRAVYTANFTPPTSPLGKTSGGVNPPQGTECVFLTAQSNRFRDSSDSNIGLNISGSPTVTPFSPFAPTAAYSAAAVGGSGYFDSNGDFLSGIGTTSSFNFMHNTTALFTIEAWVYKTVAGSQMQIAVNNDSASANIGTSFYITTANQLSLFISRGVGGAVVIDTTSTGTVPINTWTHVAVTYDQSLASSNATFYINGSSAGTGNKTANTPSSSNATNALCIGARTTGADPFSGYMNGVRISNIVRSISVPTSPYTSDGNTSLLLNFTNAGVVDATAKNVLETVGNAQISTTQSKWGGGSISFASASNSNLLGNTPSNWTFLHDGSTWTVEFWLYPTDISSFQGLIATNGAGSTNIGLNVVINAGAISISFTRGVSGSAATFNSSAVLNANQWNYVGVTFTGSTKTCAFFINGASAGSSSNTGFAYSSSTSTYPPYIGQTGAPGFPYYFNGYIDDLRITRGVARTITANPTAPFPVQ